MHESFEKMKLPRCIVFCLCENCAGSLIGYLAFENTTNALYNIASEQ